MKNALLFPGQGSVFAGMGKDLADGWPEARSVYDSVASISGVDIAALSFSRDLLPLREVEIAHLAIVAHSLAAYSVIRRDDLPSVAAGHSLGELSAVIASGAVALDDGVRLVQRRGELLRDCCLRTRGGMLAVRRAPAAVIDDVVKAVGARFVIRAANVNGTEEIVLSGEEAGIRQAMRDLKSLGALVQPLPVKGAFHTPLMAEAATAFADEIARVPFRDPRLPIVSSATGEFWTTAGDVYDGLRNEILNPVRWDLVLDRFTALGVERWIEVGPGRVLTSFVQRRDRRAHVFWTTTASALARTLEEATQ
jgi:[acyl-carrier-protein] S-malonyltransferase